MTRLDFLPMGGRRISYVVESRLKGMSVGGGDVWEMRGRGEGERR